MSVLQPRLRALVVVRRAQPTILDWLRLRYGDGATVLEDRRRGGDRRQRSRPRHGYRPPETERRRDGERRRPLMLPEEQLWRLAGYRIVYRARV